jgi:acetylornithine deacetylase/succinyl-diaminopimelate desuccinylase-like protein
MKNFLFVLVLLFAACSGSKNLISIESEEKILMEDVGILAADDMLGRETGTEGEEKAAAYIIQEFEELGLMPFESIGSFKQAFPFTANPHFDATHGHPTGDSEGHNIVAYMDKGGDDYIVLGAHYDHLGMGGPFSLAPEIVAIHNGADDNASGVAGMFSILRHLKDVKMESNILVIAFSGEEFGLWGSKYFVSNLPVAKDDIRFMVNLDMIGRLSAEKELVVNGAGTSNVWDDVLRDANEDLGLQLIKKSSGSGPSDHSVFYRDSIPVLFFFTGQHEDYHKPSDDAEKLNYRGLSMITKLVAQTIDIADDYKNIPYIKTQDPEQKRMSFRVTFGITPDYVFQGEGLKVDGLRSDRPAEKAGILRGDIIIGIGENEVNNIYDYMECLNKYDPGQTVMIKLKRSGQIVELPLTF